jgi:hemerythrin-like domain-containing protein
MMLREHDLGRQYVAVLATLAAKASPWSAGDREELDAAANGYARLLRDHIHKEDAILYPMAEQRLSGSLAFQVEAGCARMEAQAAASGLRGALETLGRELVTRHVPGLGAERRAG